MTNHPQPLIEIQDLYKKFPLKRPLWDIVRKKPGKAVHAIDHISLTILKGESLGLVGESGCGKSTLARNIVRLYDPDGGEIYFKDQKISHMSHRQLRKICGHFQMIFQDPYSSLNPRMTVREIIEEVLRVHRVCPPHERQNYCRQLLEKVGLSGDLAERFPGEFSGGQRQRVGIARALALQPELIIADEPVSALDVSIQAQVINLLARLQKEMDITLLFISHDLRVVRHITQRVAVMYLGKIVEIAPTTQLFQKPLHPYSQILLSANPGLDPRVRNERILIEGEIPTPIDIPSGCRFHPRCPCASQRCRTQEPAVVYPTDGRMVACHLYAGAGKASS